MIKSSKESDEKTIETLKVKAPKQHQILTTLRNAPEPIPMRTLPKGSSAAIKSLAHKGFIETYEVIISRDPYRDDHFTSSERLAMNDEQNEALSQIMQMSENSDKKPILLSGVTGSGKTEVYLQAAEDILNNGGSVIILVPEIALTPQTVRRFKSRFQELNHLVAVLHSDLSPGERHDEWIKLRNGEARVAIGARSAIFAPLQNLGLIIVDEEHETSYKQESTPRYHARDTAIVRAKIEQCVIVLGSATPSLESWNNTLKGKYALVRMKQRADAQSMPLIRVIDMRIEAQKSKVKPLIFSEKLRAAIEQRIDVKEQTILFLNRRGYSRNAQCLSCGHKVECPHCSIALTYHQKDDRMICHMCQYQSLPPRVCPECSDPSILFAGYGTEKVEAITKKLFPTAVVRRLDTDITRKKGALQSVLEDFRRHKIDILIGTQMIAKGLHFPTVTLVGVLNADLSLHTPDFRASEKTFQLLTQVAGRSGRGDREGEVFIQTFSPHSPSIQFARHHDFEQFAEQELEFRKAFSYPPFFHLTIILCTSTNEQLAQFSLETIQKKIVSENSQLSPPPLLIGDVFPAPLEKTHDEYRYQLIIRSTKPKMMSTLIQECLKKIPTPKTVRITCDVDAYNLT